MDQGDYPVTGRHSEIIVNPMTDNKKAHGHDGVCL